MLAGLSVEADASGGNGTIRRGLLPALAAAMLVLALFAGARAQERTTSTTSGFEAKLEYCKTCHGLSGPGLSRIFPDSASCRTTARLYRGPVARLHRTAAHQSDHVQCGSRVKPDNDLVLGEPFPSSQSTAVRRRAEGRSRDGQADLRRRVARIQRSRLLRLSRRGRSAARTKFQDWRASFIPTWSAS